MTIRRYSRRLRRLIVKYYRIQGIFNTPASARHTLAEARQVVSHSFNTRNKMAIKNISRNENFNIFEAGYFATRISVDRVLNHSGVRFKNLRFR